MSRSNALDNSGAFAILCGILEISDVSEIKLRIAQDFVGRYLFSRRNPHTP